MACPMTMAWPSERLALERSGESPEALAGTAHLVWTRGRGTQWDREGGDAQWPLSRDGTKVCVYSRNAIPVDRVVGISSEGRRLTAASTDSWRQTRCSGCSGRLPRIGPGMMPGKNPVPILYVA